MERLLERYVNLVLSHTRGFLAAVLLVLIASLALFPTANLGSSIESMFFGEEHHDFQRYKELTRQFGSDEAVIVAIEADNPFVEPTLGKLQKAHAAVDAMEDIERVVSPVSFSRMGLVGDSIKERNFSEIASEDPTRAADLLAEIQNDDEVGGLLVAKDSGTFMLIGKLVPGDNRDAENSPRIVDAITDAFVASGFTREEVRYAGITPVHAEIVRQSRSNLFKLFPFVVVLLLISVFLMFGRWWPVFVNTISALIAVAIAMAFSILWNPNINIMITLVPCLVMIISFSDVVHLCSAYLLEIEHRESKHEAIVAATVDVGQACFLTSVTTAVGFISMMFIPTPVFIQLGAVSAFGVFVAYVLAMTLVPILLAKIETPKRWREGGNRAMQSAIDQLLDLCASVSTKRPWLVIVASGLAIVWCVAGASQITFETEFLKRLGPSSQVRVDQDFFAETFASTSTVELYVDTGKPEGVLDAKTFNAIAAAQAEIEAHPQVDKVVSIVNIMKATHQAIAGADVEFLPLTPEAIAQIFVVLEMQGIDALDPYVDFSRRSVHITAYIDEGGIRAIYNLGQDFAKILRKHVPDAKVEGTGFQSLMGDWVSDIVGGQRRGLGFSLAIIALLLVIGFRSLRTGLVSMIPNVLPLLALGAWVGWFWDLVDTDTLIIGMIAIGIGVDDTIHFITRYKLERTRKDTVDEAIRATFHFSGRGIFMTTFIFTVGFVPFVISDYLTIAFMGYLLPYCFVVAVVADLLLVPALFKVGAMK